MILNKREFILSILQIVAMKCSSFESSVKVLKFQENKKNINMTELFRGKKKVHHLKEY
jgi:hypothetical protein